MSNAINVKGTDIEIGTTAADAALDTYTRLGEVISFDGPGGSAAVIDVSNLDSTAREKRKGLKDSGQFTCQLNRIFDDAGQLAAYAAQDDDAPYNFRVTYADGTIHTFKALVMEFRTSGGGVDEVLRGQLTLEITGDVTVA